MIFVLFFKFQRRSLSFELSSIYLRLYFYINICTTNRKRIILNVAVGRSGRRRAVGVPVLANSAMPNGHRVGLSGRCVGAAERPVVAWRAAPTLPTARRHDARRGDRAGGSVGADVAEHGRSAEPRVRSAWAVRGKRAARSAAWTRPGRIRGPASWGSRAPGAASPHRPAPRAGSTASGG